MQAPQNQNTDNPGIYTEIYRRHRDFYESGKTQDHHFRASQLKLLRKVIKTHEREILGALHADLRKPEFEAFTSEIGLVYDEIAFALDHLKAWMKPQKITTPAVLFPTTSRIIPGSKGTVLIIAPWNYPVMLLLSPLVGAIAAGNTVFLKPSELAPHCAALMETLFAENFDPGYISVVNGDGAKVVSEMMDAITFDHIFFTGGTSVGKIIAQKAAKTLTPVTLELGGKSPAVVEADADITLAAKHIAWGRFFNAGQSCVSPDYVLVHRSQKQKFTDKICHFIREFWGENPQESESYGRIINHRRFDVLNDFLKDGNIIAGGQTDREDLYIAPTVVDHPSMESRLMKEEIFGPILPVIPFSDRAEAVSIIHRNPQPLAFYLFTQSDQTSDEYIRRIDFGGGCINNTMIHLASPHLPFGGVGSSGMGSYHGEQSFRTFSHYKSVMKTRAFYDNPLRYPPYNNRKTDIAQWVFD
ncbi:MAG: aldehyde dehydrogenase family protein [Bacteroidia bacterium]